MFYNGGVIYIGVSVMNLRVFFEYILLCIDPILFGVCVFLLLGSIYLTCKMRFVQCTFFPLLYKIFSKPPASEQNPHLFSPRKALFTAMSTTLGISTIVGPPIAIKLGGPGALLGFLLTAFFGSAATYVEVCLSVHYRKSSSQGKVMGGPMQYLQALLSPRAAKGYAILCMVLLMGWSAAQANQLAAVLDSQALGAFRVPTLYSGIGLAAFCLLTLQGGVKRLGAFSAKLVPIMFVLYVGSCLWIIGCNFSVMGKVLSTVFLSACKPYALASGAMVGGVISALRWGVFKGVQTTEAGIGTQSIPHSLAATADPRHQGALAMLSTFSAGGLAFLSGCVALITQTWQDPSLPLGIHMVLASYDQYFSFAGVIIVSVSALLFGFGTILGNSFNGSQCYNYITSMKKKRYYFVLTGIMIVLGAMGEVKTVWSWVDVLIALIAVPHMLALLIGAHRHKEIFALHTKQQLANEVLTTYDRA